MRSSTARGITLVEVIAGLTLMGTLLAVILVSSSQHLRQLKAAERKRVSVRMLDDFLASWSIANFQADRIPEAVRRSRLPAVGQFGHHGLEDDVRGFRSEYQVELRRVGQTGFQQGSVIRLTVTTVDAAGDRIPTTWAEVMVPQ